MDNNDSVKVIYNGKEIEARRVPPRKRRGLGDIVEKIAKPIAKALKLPCLDEQGNLKPESGCGKRKEELNQIKLS